MNHAALPGGPMALALAWFGGAGLFCAGLVFVIHGVSVPALGLALVAIWSAVALALGIALRMPRASALKLAGMFWLAVAAGGAAWLRWSKNG